MGLAAGRETGGTDAIRTTPQLHCSMLAEDAIKAAVKDWKEKNQTA